jgi:hypothetical protein
MGKSTKSSLLGNEDARVVQRAVEAALVAVLQEQKRPAKSPPASKVKRVKAAAGSPKRSHRGFRGLPPPPEFDLDAMPAANLLTEYETAAATRLSTSTLAAWRKRPDHPLQWVKIGTRVRYRAGSVRQFIATGQRPQVGRPRKKDPVPAPKPPKHKSKPSGTPAAITEICTPAAVPERRRAPRGPRAADAATAETT